MPVTPDYGEPLVCFADGVFDPRINRYVTVQEGSISVYYYKERFIAETLFVCILSSYILTDCRQSSINSVTAIVTINLDDQEIQGKFFFLNFLHIYIYIYSASITSWRMISCFFEVISLVFARTSH